ncbi:hypothetical protein JVU11DRAFT_10801 [Chiua virens]|nr:hypothetical protein JVU11DRAFT_10801 [Chiua virens]
MPPPSTSIQAGDVLDEIIQFIRQEYDNFSSELCETDQKKLQRVNEHIYAKVRARLGEKGDPLGSASNPTGEGMLPERDAGLSLSPDNSKPAAVQNARMSDMHEAINTPLEQSSEVEPKSDSSRPRRRTPPPLPSPREEAIARLLPKIAVISPSSVSTTSSIPPQKRSTQLLSETTPTSPASACSTSSIPPRRRPPPAPPLPREVARARLFSEATPTSPGSSSGTSSMLPQGKPAPAPSQRRVTGSRNSLLSSETASDNQRITPHRRSQSVRVTGSGGVVSPQSGARSSVVIGPSPTAESFVVSDPAVFSNLAHQITMLVSDIVKDLPKQVHGQQGRRFSDHHFTKTNCVDMIDSNVVGLTMNNGGTKNSGAVIRETLSPRVPRY